MTTKPVSNPIGRDGLPVPWTTCIFGSGCIGITLDGGRCLAHVNENQVGAALRQLRETGAIDARGVRIDTSLLKRLLDSLPRDGEGRWLGQAWFDQATFVGEADFDDVIFRDEARFYYATFEQKASFQGATFKADARFEGARFKRRTVFMQAKFEDLARFEDARVEKEAWFHRAEFESGTWFDNAIFMDLLWLAEVAFETARHFGPILVYKELRLNSSLFKQRVRIEVATPRLSGKETRFLAGVQLRVRWAQINFDDAEFAAAAILAGAPPFTHLDEGQLVAAWPDGLGGPPRPPG
jgi:uncharacterized protein YjbI with pentapeptide repeats